MRVRFCLPAIALVAGSALGLSACSGHPGATGDGAKGPTSTAAADAPKIVREPDFELPKVTGKWGELPAINPVDTKPPKDIVAKLITPGDGDEVMAGGMVSIYYTGVLWDGKSFDSSFNHGDGPMTLDLNKVIDGWKYALPGSKVGDRILLVVPPEYGYGSKGTDSIPGGSTLVFVIDIAVAPGSDLTALKKAKPTNAKLPEGVIVSGALGEAPGVGFEEGAAAPKEQVEVTIAKGSGAAVKPGDTVAYHYTGAYWGNPSAAESTWTGSPTVQPAQDTLFLGHNVGDRVLFVFPAKSESVPALVMVVDIIGVH